MDLMEVARDAILIYAPKYVPKKSIMKVKLPTTHVCISITNIIILFVVIKQSKYL